MSNVEKEQIGTCPRCGSPIYEGRINFYCSNIECKFCLWKESKWLTGMRQSISKEMAKELLTRGRVFVRDFYSQKKDKFFDADLVMEDTGEYVNYKLEFLD